MKKELKKDCSDPKERHIFAELQCVEFDVKNNLYM